MALYKGMGAWLNSAYLPQLTSVSPRVPGPWQKSGKRVSMTSAKPAMRESSDCRTRLRACLHALRRTSQCSSTEWYPASSRRTEYGQAALPTSECDEDKNEGNQA